MKKIIIDSIINNIKKYYSYSEEKISEIRYGIEAVYLSIFKLLVITLIALALNIFKEYLLIMIFYSILKLTGFGLHAKKSIHCWISSILIFLGAPILSTQVELSKMLIILLSIACTILISIFAPADTEKRPIINRKRRKIYKILCTLTALVYTFIIVINNNIVLNNILLFSMMIQIVIILPVSYRLFGVKYANYKTYNSALYN